MEEKTQDSEAIPAVPCENCPKGVKDGMMFVKDGRTYCCGDCAKAGKRENTCEFC